MEDMSAVEKALDTVEGKAVLRAVACEVRGMVRSDTHEIEYIYVDFCVKDPTSDDEENKEEMRGIFDALVAAKSLSDKWVKIEADGDIAFALKGSDGQIYMRCICNYDPYEQYDSYHYPPFGTIRFFADGYARFHHVYDFTEAMRLFLAEVDGGKFHAKIVQVMQ